MVVVAFLHPDFLVVKKNNFNQKYFCMKIPLWLMHFYTQFSGKEGQFLSIIFIYEKPTLVVVLPLPDLPREFFFTPIKSTFRAKLHLSKPR